MSRKGELESKSSTIGWSGAYISQMKLVMVMIAQVETQKIYEAIKLGARVHFALVAAGSFITTTRRRTPNERE